MVYKLSQSFFCLSKTNKSGEVEERQRGEKNRSDNTLTLHIMGLRDNVENWQNKK